MDDSKEKDSRDFDDLRIDIQDYIRKYHEEELLGYLNKDKEHLESLNIDLSNLKEVAPKLFKSVAFDTWDTVPIWNQVLQDLQLELLDNSHTFIQENYSIKQHIFPRFSNLPKSAEIDTELDPYRIPSKYPNPERVGELIELKGTIVRKQERQMLEIKREYNCKICNQAYFIKSKEFNSLKLLIVSIPSYSLGFYNEMYEFQSTYKCTTIGCKKAPLKHKVVEEVPDWKSVLDLQQLTIQEHQTDTYVTKCIRITIDNELVDRFQAGERVIVW